ncbi:MAG TPA: hypothetical protein VIX60_08240 [Candidatus Cybelea sp.]
MQTMRSYDPVVEAMVGYAAAEAGNGLAYVRITGAQSKQLLRIGFRVTASKPWSDRTIGYAALTAVSHALGKRGAREVRFILGNPEFVEEIATGQGVGETLVLSYVRLRCALNSLAKFGVQAGATEDLTNRARAEVVLNVAA